MTTPTQHKFTRIGSILAQILQRWSLERPDRRPLYAYKVNDGELSHLAHSLKSIFDERENLDLEESAGLVLLAAERFCARHETGHWRWETALGEVLPTEWGADKRFYQSLAHGLTWWRRSVVVSRGTREFLVTMACEGGLPLAVVRREGTHLRNYFGRLLRTREEFPTLDLEDSARSLAYLLPSSWVNEQLFALAVRLVDAIAELRQVIQGRPDPLEVLRIEVPGWEHRIPLRIDAQEARALLEGLLTAPAPAATASSDELFVRLELDTSIGFGVGREPIFPSLLSRESLASLLRSDAAELPTRLMLSMEFSDGARRPFARCTSIHGGASYRLEATGHRSARVGDALSGRIDLVASSSGTVSRRVLFPGGEELAELPWVFVDPPSEQTTSRLLGMGSVRVRAPTAIVVASCGSTPRGHEVERIDEVPSLNRLAWRVRGETAFEYEGEVSVVRTSQERDDEARYALSGRSSALGPGLGSFWIGTPRLYEHTDDGRRRAVRGPSLQFRGRSGLSREWRPLEDSARGEGELRYVEHGETRFKTKLTILDADFACRVDAGPGNREGALVFRGVGIESISPQSLPGCSFEVSVARNGDHRVTCTQLVPGERPAAVRVAIALHSRASAVIEAPFPAPQVAFVASRGRVLANRELVSLECVVSLRASVQTARSAPYFLEALCARGRSHLADLVPSGEGHFELSLEQVYPRLEQMLASDDDIDAEVELRILRLGVESPGGDARLRVRNSDRTLVGTEVDELGQTIISVEPSLGETGGDLGVSAVATPIWAPGATPQVLAAMDREARWIFPPVGASPGPWLVTAWQGAHLMARPTCFVVGRATPSADGPEVSEQPCALALSDAVRSSGGKLRESVSVVIRRVGRDPDDADWALLSDYLASLATLPANTYDVVKVLVSDPDAIAMAVLKTIPKPYFRIFWEQVERLPFLWSLVPFTSWLRAANGLLAAYRLVYAQLSADLRAAYDATSDMKALLARLREHSDRRSPFLECTADALSFRLFGEVPKSGLLGLAVRDSKGLSLLSALDGAHNWLRIRNDGRNWPQQKLGTLLERAGIIPTDPRIPWIKPRKQDTNDVLNAPVVAAALAVLIPRDERVEKDTVVALQALRSFDAEWFDEAHAIASAILLPRWLAQNLEE